MIRTIFKKIRKIVPVSMYPMLGSLYRWDRRRTIRRLQNEDDRYRQAHPDVVAPDAELRFNVVGAVDIPAFLAGGRLTADDIEAALGKANASMRTIRSGLDFGCGCGRLLLEASHRWPETKWYGADVDERAVAWCQKNLPTVVSSVNQPLPPLPFADGQFDLVWVGSVFTHLDEERQDAWLAELRRVLAPDGYLVASVHGPNCWNGLPASVVREIHDKGFVFAVTGADKGIHPDWYQTAWHTREYVEKHWRKYVDVVAYLPQGFSNYQDIVVCRRRSGE